MVQIKMNLDTMNLDTDIVLHLTNAEIKEMILGLNVILFAQGKELTAPRGDGKYMKCGYQHAEYIVQNENLRIVFQNIDS